VGVCPDDPEETAEAYLLNSLPAEERARFEAHYLTCEKCADALTGAEDYVASIRAAAQRLRQSM
jgi:anti-sigma factor RsiW